MDNYDLDERTAANTAIRDEFRDWQGSGRDFVWLCQRMNAAAIHSVQRVRDKRRERGCGH